MKTITILTTSFAISPVGVGLKKINPQPPQKNFCDYKTWLFGIFKIKHPNPPLINRKFRKIFLYFCCHLAHIRPLCTIVTQPKPHLFFGFYMLVTIISVRSSSNRGRGEFAPSFMISKFWKPQKVFFFLMEGPLRN